MSFNIFQEEMYFIVNRPHSEGVIMWSVIYLYDIFHCSCFHREVQFGLCYNVKLPDVESLKIYRTGTTSFYFIRERIENRFLWSFSNPMCMINGIFDF